MPTEVAYEALGRQTLGAYRKTLVGRVVMAALQMSSVKHALQLSVRGFRLVSNYSQHEVIEDGPSALTYRAYPSTMPPHYTLGLLHEMMAASGHDEVTISMDLAHVPDRVDFHVSW
ncbi:MAG TPA: DUF2378 family protein [Chloroflexia bacterium]|nr:DUF2378 family protein [Chloroflexia bacterium]